MSRPFGFRGTWSPPKVHVYLYPAQRLRDATKINVLTNLGGVLRLEKSSNFL